VSRHHLVTGGTGFLGSALVRRLVARGEAVRVLDNGSRGHVGRLEDLATAIEYVDGDVRDPAVVADACRGIDVVCHLAFINGTEYFYSKPDLVLDVALRGMMNVVQGAQRHRVPELLVVSSSEVYQEPATVPTDEQVALTIPDVLNPRYSYAGGKIVSELVAINYGRRSFERVTIVRPHNVYGPDMGTEHVIPQFVARLKGLQRHPSEPIPFPIQGTGRQTRSFVFIDDFTDGLMLVLDRGEHLGIYNIGTREEVSIETLAHLVARHFGRPIAIVPGLAAEGGTNRRCPDISKIAALGYDPAWRLEEALPGVVRWYDDRLAASTAPPVAASLTAFFPPAGT
jgi:dTDP-glucose 4,6-dehydratase/UDP-glucose 4-epimerase